MEVFNMNSSIKAIHSQKVAGFLMLKGFVLKGISENKTLENDKLNKKRNVFLFNDTEELRNTINEFDGFFNLNKKALIRKL
jgi:hypothetical protein